MSWATENSSGLIHSSGGWKSAIRQSKSGLVPLGHLRENLLQAFLLASNDGWHCLVFLKLWMCRPTLCLHLHMVFPCVCVFLWPSSYKDASHAGLGPHPTPGGPHINLSHLCKHPISK